MSSPVSPLGGAVHPGEVTVRDAGLTGMISLRGDLSLKKLRTLCTRITGAAFPDQGQMTGDADAALVWMSRDEILLIVAYDDVADALEKIATALKGQHHLATNVSDARAVMFVEGAYSREVIAKLAPVDLHPDHFSPGDVRRTRLGQVAAAFWMIDQETFQVVCFRSVAQYTFDLLAASAQAGPVGVFQPQSL